MARASTFTQQIADAICARLAAGESLRAICRDEGMPQEATVRNWVVNDIEGFSAQYVRARDIGLDCIADEIREISDTPAEGVTETTKEWGTEVKRGDMIEHRKLQVDARKWYLSKLAPKKYGDRQAIDLSGQVSIAEAIVAARNRSGGA